jgi:hypothetical protein
MILKGQNFRVMTVTGSDAKVVGMATNCVVTLTGNSEDASHKDIVGMAALPEIVSKSWQVQVDSLDVTDTAAMLTAIKNKQPFKLQWDETSTDNNQGPLAAAFARTGMAYLSDGSFVFNNRENSTKSLQFSGTGALTKTTITEYVNIAPAGFTKGQFVRLFVGSDNTAAPSKVIAAATSLTLHVSLTLEDATTKDTTGDWVVQEPTGLSYDISTSALMRGDDTITSSVDGQAIDNLEDIYEASQPVKWKIANVSGENNRTAGATIVSGSVVITQLTLNGPNRQNATYDAQLTGYGDYTVGA